MIIGFVGKAQAGKTTLAKYLEEKYEFVRVAFGDPVKEMIIKAGFFTHDQLYMEKSPEARVFMQRFATDLFRNQVDPEFWVKKTRERIKDILDEKKKFYMAEMNWVIDDVRFVNEADFIRRCALPYLIRIDRPVGIEIGKDHRSEIENEHIVADFRLLNDSSVNHLYKGIDRILSNLWK